MALASAAEQRLDTCVERRLCSILMEMPYSASPSCLSAAPVLACSPLAPSMIPIRPSHLSSQFTCFDLLAFFCARHSLSGNRKNLRPPRRPSFSSATTAAAPWSGKIFFAISIPSTLAVMSISTPQLKTSTLCARQKMNPSGRGLNHLLRSTSSFER